MSHRNGHIRAIVFDFDGLILDTEIPEYEAWREVFRAHGCDLPLAEWAKCIGTSSAAFDPIAYLEAQVGRPVNGEIIRRKHRARCGEIVDGQPLMPGIRETIDAAKRLGLLLAVASSSRHERIDRRLRDHGLFDRFDCVRCADDVPVVKPDPALYLAALACLDVRPAEAIALEDSPNGVLAANRAGIFAVAVPNALTRELPLDHADLRIDSLADVTLADLLAAVERTRGRGAFSSSDAH